MSNEEALELLKQIINIETIDGNERKVVDVLAEVFSGYDIPTEIIPFKGDPNRAQLIATLEGTEEGPTIALSGHIDVVPVSSQPWRYDPFEPTVNQSILYGRGASDMKSGLAAEAVALINLKASGVPFKGTVKFIATDAEEVGLLGAEALAHAGYIGDVDAMVIGEPTSMQIAHANKGVFDFVIKAYGRAAHTSEPDLGTNAINHILLTLQALREKLDIMSVKDEILGTASASLNKISGGTSHNIVPDEAEAFIDIRPVSGQDSVHLRESIQEIISELEATIPDYHVEYEQIYDILAVATPADHPLIRVAQEALTAHNYDSQLNTFKGATDASKFRLANNDCGIIILGPGNGASAHQPDENVKVEDYYRAIEIYQDIVKNYLVR